MGIGVSVACGLPDGKRSAGKGENVRIRLFDRWLVDFGFGEGVERKTDVVRQHWCVWNGGGRKEGKKEGKEEARRGSEDGDDREGREGREEGGVRLFPINRTAQVAT